MAIPLILAGVGGVISALSTPTGMAVAGATALAAGNALSNAMYADEKEAKKNEALAQEQANITASLNDDETKNAFLNYQAQQPQGANTQERGNTEGFIYDSDTTQKLAAQAQAQSPQQQFMTQNDNETMQLAQGMQQARFRNTGIDYFDKLEKPTIGDLYLAKLLGLNMAYNYVDLNANVNQKTTNKNTALQKMHSTNNAVLGFTEGIDDYIEKDLGSTGNTLSRGWNRATGGFFSFTSDDNKREQGLNEYRTRAVASMMSENPRGVTQKELDIARDMTSTNWKDKTGVMADTHNFLTLARMKQQEEMNKINELGLGIPIEEQLKLQAIDNMIDSISNGQYNSAKFTQNRQAILNLQQNKGDPKAINEAMKILFSK